MQLWYGKEDTKVIEKSVCSWALELSTGLEDSVKQKHSVSIVLAPFRAIRNNDKLCSMPEA